MGMNSGTLSTVIDQICELKGLTVDQSGLVGGIMLIAGIIGAIVLPPLSDKYRKRKAFLILAMAGMTPGLFGLTSIFECPNILFRCVVLRKLEGRDKAVGVGEMGLDYSHKYVLARF